MVVVIDAKPHPSVVKETICRNCGATLQYTPADRRSRKVSDYGGGSEIIHYIKCPPCGHEVSVKGY